MNEHLRTTPAANKIVASREDLANLLGHGIVQLSTIAASPRGYYTEFVIPKRNGEPRVIRPPCKLLRGIQRRLLMEIYDRVRIPPWIHGGVPRKSILTHARGHVGRKAVMTLDVRSFFPNTSGSNVHSVLNGLGFVDAAAEQIVSLTMLDGGVPQGAPTSSILANLSFAASDVLFFDFCKRHRLFYSRYVDDIAISGTSDLGSMRGTFADFIRASGYDVADDKVCVMPDNERQVITGLVVNDMVRPTREYTADLRHQIRLCLSKGALNVAVCEGVSVATLKSSLTGHARFVEHIDPPTGKKLRGMLCGVSWSSHD